MADKSAIEWTQATWNPTRGCTRCSPGCARCYAKRFAERFRGVPGHAYEQGFDLRLVPEMLDLPKTWKRGRLVFVNSMSDLFHKDIPVDYVAKVFKAMAETPQHTYQVLTKRSDRMVDFLAGTSVPPNVWCGVSVENQRFTTRIRDLQRVNAKVRFLSVEPLLGPIDDLPLDGIHWVIVGGESGPGARPLRAEWVRAISDRCVVSGIPFFFKQWGGANKKKAGRVLDGRTWDEMPSVATPSPARGTLRIIE